MAAKLTPTAAAAPFAGAVEGGRFVVTPEVEPGATPEVEPGATTPVEKPLVAGEVAIGTWEVTAVVMDCAEKKLESSDEYTESMDDSTGSPEMVGRGGKVGGMSESVVGTKMPLGTVTVVNELRNGEKVTRGN